MKICTQCSQEKDETEFYSRGPYLHNQCKRCICAKCKIYRHGKINTVHRYDQERTWARKGILTEEGRPFLLKDFDRLYQIQGGRCRICQKHSTEFTRMLAVDHNHDTGLVRSLLCANCNCGIGNFHDNKVILKEAIKYISRFQIVE